MTVNTFSLFVFCELFLPHDAMLAHMCCGHMSVCLSLTSWGVLSKRLNIASRKQRHAIRQRGMPIGWAQGTM